MDFGLSVSCPAGNAFLCGSPWKRPFSACYYLWMESGEDRAWEIIAGRPAEEVQREALAGFDGERGCYLLRSLNMEYAVCPGERTIYGATPEAEAVAGRFSYFLNHSVLWYLAAAKDIGLTGRLLKPESLKGGHHFFTGTHELPLRALAGKYGHDRDAFLARARELGGRELGFGDASAELLPLPRVPVTLIVWLGDEEFPPRADLLLDSSCEIQLSLDIIWSVAMLSVLVML